MSAFGLRRATTEDAFNYDAIEAIVAWNDPDDEHTRSQLMTCLEDLIDNAVREREEGKPPPPSVSASAETTPTQEGGAS